MNFYYALILGVLQGATEFLPVSSSGHLFLAQKLLGLREPELAFDTLLHLGTLLAVVVFLRREIAEILRSILRRRRDFEEDAVAWGRRDVLLLVVSMIPTGVIGLAFHDAVETGITVRGVGIRYLLLTSFLVLSSLRIRHKMDPDRIEIWEAFAIGCIQGAAVFPGLSRSGSTISLALILGIGASRSAKYSFMVSLPAILGAALVNLRHGVSVLPPLAPSVAGFACAMVVGYVALWFVERLVTRGRFIRFAPYTVALAALCFYLSWKG